MTPMIDFSKVLKERETLINQVNGIMTVFPLCCSTGVLKGVNAGRPDESVARVFSGTVEYAYPLVELKSLENARTMASLMRAVKGNPYFVFPQEVGTWFMMGLIHDKIIHGTDEGASPGYNGYKASSIAMFDRFLEDKDPSKGFKFQYNMIFSIDHFQQWLSEQNGVYGEVYVSPPAEGAHGARVRGSIFTPDKDAMIAYEKERFSTLKDHIMANWAILKDRVAAKKVTDVTARMW